MTDWYAEGRIDGIKEGKAEGIKEGKEEGIKEGRNRKSAEDIIILMDRYGENLDNALDIMKVPEQDREETLRLVRELQASS